MASSPSLRPTFSREQVQAYFDRISLPEKHRQFDVAGLGNQDALEYLTRLQTLHLVAIPFENLTLHYSFHRQITIDHEELFKKIVADKNGRGGYCMENNCLLGTLLRSLGYKLYSAGGRVFDNGHWTGWSHMVNIVTIGGHRYHVDVGFGANGPIVPMKLDNGPVQEHISPASARLRWTNLDANTDPDQRLWVYEHKINEQSDFETTYCFSELEFLPQDYAVMNLATSTSPRSFFAKIVLVAKKILGDDGETLVGSQILLNDNLKWRIREEKVKEVKLASEGDRIQALVEHFGIRLSLAEQESIRGLPTELK